MTYPFPVSADEFKGKRVLVINALGRLFMEPSDRRLPGGRFDMIIEFACLLMTGPRE